MNGYDLSRQWFDFCFDNPEKINPNHTALYFFIIEHCNRLGWKEKFGLPSEMTKEAIGIHSYNTYIKTLNNLIEWGFIVLVQKSRNQYSSNIIALSKFDKAVDRPRDRALDKATIKHVTEHVIKHHTKQRESISSIDKPITINQEPIKPINQEPLKVVFPENKFPEPEIQIIQIEEKKEVINEISLHQRLINKHTTFYMKKTGMQYKFSGGSDGKAAKEILTYIKSAQKSKNGTDSSDDEIIAGFQFILDSYGKWEQFYQGQLKLSQINSNLPNIIANIKGISKNKNNESRLETFTGFADIVAGMGK